MNEKISRCFLWLRSRPTWFWLTVILIFSFSLKLFCWYLDPVVSRDGSLYIRLAQVWYDTGDFQAVLRVWLGIRLLPLPIYLMKLLMYLGIPAEAAGVGLNLILGTFTPLLAYGIAYEVLQRKDIALCSALLIAVSPTMNKLSVEVQRDMIYLFFIGLALWFLTAGVRRRKWWFWLAASMACCIALLTRYETLELLVIVPFSLFLLVIKKTLSWKNFLHYACLFCVGCIVSLYVLASVMRTQDYIFSNFRKFYLGKVLFIKKQLQSAPEDSVK